VARGVAPVLPDVARAPLADDRGLGVEGRRRRRSQDHEVAVVVGRRDQPMGRPNERWTAPRRPAEALVEAVAAGAQDADLEAGPNQLADRRHRARAVAPGLLLRDGRHGLHAAGPQALPSDLDRSFDHGGMRDDSSAVLNDDVATAQGVLPVVLRKAVLVGLERRPEKLANRAGLVSRELGRRQRPGPLGVDEGHRAIGPRGVAPRTHAGRPSEYDRAPERGRPPRIWPDSGERRDVSILMTVGVIRVQGAAEQRARIGPAADRAADRAPAPLSPATEASYDGDGHRADESLRQPGIRS